MTAQIEKSLIENKISNVLFYTEWASLAGLLITCFGFLFYQNQLQTERWTAAIKECAEIRAESNQKWSDMRAESNQKWSDMRAESDRKFYDLLKERSK